MTDTELLDGLQRLFDQNAVCVLRTCRSGVKLELAERGYAYANPDAPFETPLGFREYFGTGGTWSGDPNYGERFGSDIRGAIRKALAVESTPHRLTTTPHG
jgi:hypothetical protein